MPVAQVYMPGSTDKSRALHIKNRVKNVPSHQAEDLLVHNIRVIACAYEALVLR
jgi:hypothetical protein